MYDGGSMNPATMQLLILYLIPKQRFETMDASNKKVVFNRSIVSA